MPRRPAPPRLLTEILPMEREGVTPIVRTQNPTIDNIYIYEYA